ncbi:MAG: 50S ribosomal protein L21 [Sedimentisphaerales bacterium]|nr:50S ribosomal protein L21 [Sedimentisphaerales bacterium]
MYAVIEQGGRQYKVSEGQQIKIDLTQVDPQAKDLQIDKVLLVNDGKNLKIGRPYVEGAKVIATFQGTAQESIVNGPKLYPTYFRRRKNSKRRIGHRQKYLQVTISKIVC